MPRSAAGWANDPREHPGERDNRGVDTDQRTGAEFEAHRPRLLALAYRLTGSPADAEDAVQEAWLRLAGLDAAARDGIHELGAWLTTVVGRLCLDRMRSAAARREHYVGSWLPEPVVESDADRAGPLEAVVRREDMRMAALRVLHQLPPDQRLALVLHEGFDVPFAEIADMLGCAVATARQHASRARRVMDRAEPPPRVAMSEQRDLVERFLAAVSSGDVEAVSRVLHPGVAFHGDGGGKARTAINAVVGRDKVVRLTLGLLARYGDALLAGVRPVLVNGDPGLLVPDTGGEPGPHVVTFAVRDGRLAEIHDLANPDKLRRIPT